MNDIDEYIAAQDAREQVYRLSLENLYLKEQVRRLEDELQDLRAYAGRDVCGKQTTK
jgi:hypothetical protein